MATHRLNTAYITLATQRRAVETQQALTTQVWEGGAPGVPAPSRLWPGIDLHAYQWAVAMVWYAGRGRGGVCLGGNVTADWWGMHAAMCG